MLTEAGKTGLSAIAGQPVAVDDARMGGDRRWRGTEDLTVSGQAIRHGAKTDYSPSRALRAMGRTTRPGLGKWCRPTVRLRKPHAWRRSVERLRVLGNDQNFR